MVITRKAILYHIGMTLLIVLQLIFATTPFYVGIIVMVILTAIELIEPNIKKKDTKKQSPTPTNETQQ